MRKVSSQYLYTRLRICFDSRGTLCVRFSKGATMKHAALSFLLCLLAGSHALAESAEKQEQSAPPPENNAEPVLRTEGPMAHMRFNRSRTLLAFTDERGQSLRVLDLKTNEIIEVSPHRIGPGYFWSPDDARLFFRELTRENNVVSSDFKAYDSYLNRTISLDKIEGSSGYPTLDPRDNTVYILHGKGILSKRLEFPGERFARWQGKKKTEGGTWVATQKSILWLSDLGLTMKSLEDDGSGIESYDLSPDGKRMAWATKGGRIYTAHTGEKVQYLGRGRDPRWHPERALLLYAAGRSIGPKIYDYDIRVCDPNGFGRFVTVTPARSERWPQWFDEDSVLFTVPGTTDIWRKTLRESAPAEIPSAKGKSKTEPLARKNQSGILR